MDCFFQVVLVVLLVKIPEVVYLGVLFRVLVLLQGMSMPVVLPEKTPLLE